MDNNFTDNNNENSSAGHSNQRSDYSAPEPYDADAQYGFSSAGGYQYGSSSANGNYNNGMNFGQPPLDKKGRPVPNNFGMKLTFAIIEIVISFWMTFGGTACMGGIPLILSAIAAVFVCLQNKEYNERNWDGFVSRRRVSNVLLWVAFGILMAWVLLLVVGVVLILAGVTSFGSYLYDAGLDLDDLNISDGYHSDYDDLKDDLDDDIRDLLDDLDDDLNDGDDHSDHSHAGDYSGASIENTNGENVADVDGFETFTFSGEKISLPVSCKDFRAAGFALGEMADEKLEAGENSGYPYYDAEGNHRGTVFIFNTTEKKIKAKDGIIGGITIEDNYDQEDLEMVGGLGFDSTLEECVQVLGSRVTDENVGDEYNSYSWWFEKGGYYTSIEIGFDADEEVRSVWIMNTLDLY